MFKATKTTKGKQRIEMRKIQNKDARYISFSKRRSVFFVKASELSTLCSFDQVMNRFLSSAESPGRGRQSQGGRAPGAVRGQDCKWLDDIDALGSDELDRIDVRTREILMGANPESVAVDRVGSSPHGGIATVNPLEPGRPHPNPSIATIDFVDISGSFEGIQVRQLVHSPNEVVRRIVYTKTDSNITEKKER
ncbi:hypothetical protein GW17_00016267 [Ensete ventricosum]|nr:hypothetical protein GW17_00016267 [Ensete ventricosum]